MMHVEEFFAFDNKFMQNCAVLIKESCRKKLALLDIFHSSIRV